MKRAELLLLIAIAFIRCAALGGEEEERRARAAPNRILSRVIDNVARGAPADAFRVRVEWSRGGRMVSAELYGNGAGIWNDERAFRVTPAEIADVARALRDARFAAMPERFGEAESDFLTMRGKVSVAVGDAAKTVVQIDRGAQSDALAGLAAGILARAEAGGRVGVGAGSLGDGLRKIASGELPAEALRVTVQVRGENGFLLQIRGGEATARRFDPKSGYGAPRRMRIDARDLASHIQALPQSAYAPVYTELRVEVLGRVEESIGRPEQRGAPLVIDALRGIAERTLAEGKPAPAVE